LLDYPEETVGGVLLAGGTHPWEGGVAWYYDLAGVPIIGNLFVQTFVYPFGQLSLDTAIENVFAPNPVTERYAERTGVRLSLRPDTFLANAEDIRSLSDYLAIQSRRYGEINRPVLAVTGEKDTIVPAWNHADRLIRQIPGMEHVELEDAGHAFHHTHPERIAGLIASFSRRLAGTDAHDATGQKQREKSETRAQSHTTLKGGWSDEGPQRARLSLGKDHPARNQPTQKTQSPSFRQGLAEPRHSKVTATMPSKATRSRQSPPGRRRP
jgi:hypothetical protein